MSAVTERADRDALLRYLDFCNDLQAVLETYADLPAITIYATLLSKGHEFAAVVQLPQRYVPPFTAAKEEEPK